MRKWLKRLALTALVLITILGVSLWTAAWSIQDRLLSSSAAGLDIDSVAAGGEMWIVVQASISRMTTAKLC